MPDANDFEGRVAQLRARFDERLDRDSAEILSLALAGPPGPGAGLERIRFLAHGLRGSGGTFGREDAGSLAAELENLAVEALENPSTSTSANSDAIGRLARQLRDISRCELAAADERRTPRS